MPPCCAQALQRLRCAEADVSQELKDLESAIRPHHAAASAQAKDTEKGEPQQPHKHPSARK